MSVSTARRKLTLDDVVAAGLGVAHTDGLYALTMRAVATRLGASPMGLYRHVADRAELIDRVADASLADLELPPAPPDDGLRDWIVTVLDRLRELMLAVPGTADHFMLNGPTGPHSLTFMAEMCAVLRRTGRTPERTAWAYDWLMSTAAAYVSKETRIAAGERSRAAGEALRDRVARVMRQRPDLAEVVAHFRGDMDAAFHRATGAVIDAILADPTAGTER